MQLIYLALIVSLALAGFATWLLVRLVRAAGQARRALLGRGADPLTINLSKCVNQAIDASLLRQAGKPGLEDMMLRFREHLDPYRNVNELLVFIGEKSRADAQPDLDALIKATFQLAASLHCQMAELNSALGVLTNRLCRTTTAAARVQVIAPGDLVDASTMIPLTYGARVTFPLGMVVFDSENRVVSRAKVCCA